VQRVTPLSNPKAADGENLVREINRGVPAQVKRYA
jgi:hypothetical protein